jgi:hypothetical protein
VLRLFFFDSQHFTTMIRTALGTNLVRGFVFAAFVAHYQVQARQMIVRTPFIATRLG